MQERGQAGESSQELCYRSGETLALSSHSTFLHNHTAAKHMTMSPLTLGCFRGGDNKQVAFLVSISGKD